MRYEDVWLRYGRRGPWVLRGVTGSVAPGEVVVLTGRNGAGKSTLLQVAAGVLRPSRGRLVDRPARVGWVPERFPAEQPFAVRDYLMAMGGVAGVPSDELGPAVEAWLERLGLSAYRGVRLAELSKGTAQKVGLAQALLVAPTLLILDEPWEGLDKPTRDLVPGLVRDITGAGGMVLISDHRGETALLPEATVWALSDGVVTAAGDGAPRHCIVEIAVPAARVAGAVAEWRAAGHEVVRVRDAAEAGQR